MATAATDGPADGAGDGAADGPADPTAGGPIDNSVSLLARIQGGDAAALEALYVRYRDRLLFAIRCRLGPALRARLESEDVLHSVVREAIGDLQRFEPRSEGALGRYLHVCVLNKIRTKAAYHGAARRAEDQPLSPHLEQNLARDHRRPDGGLGYVDAERYERLEAALHRLPAEMRQVVELRSFEAMTNAEAAEATGKSAAATAKIYQRAIARLGMAVGAR